MYHFLFLLARYVVPGYVEGIGTPMTPQPLDIGSNTVGYSGSQSQDRLERTADHSRNSVHREKRRNIVPVPGEDYEQMPIVERSRSCGSRS
jgi:hypothetical protein